MAKNILRACAAGCLILMYSAGCAIGCLLIVFGAGCDTSVNVPTCGRQIKTIYWHKPEKWDGSLSIALYLSKDNRKWELQWSKENQSFWLNGQTLDVDTCTPTYFCAAMSDEYGRKSADAGCFGNNCETVVIPEACFDYEEKGPR